MANIGGDLVQSPILNFISIMDLVDQYEEEDRDFKARTIKNMALMEEEVDGSPEILRGSVQMKRGEKSKRNDDKGGRVRVRRRREKTILTVEQFKAILSLCIEGVLEKPIRVIQKKEKKKEEKEKPSKKSVTNDLIGLTFPGTLLFSPENFFTKMTHNNGLKCILNTTLKSVTFGRRHWCRHFSCCPSSSD